MTARRAAWLTLALGFALVSTVGTARGEGYYMTEPGPKATVRVARPTLVWRIFPEADTRVSNALMSINGIVVQPSYSPEWGALYFTPQEPLPPGPYEVACRLVTTDGTLVHTKEVAWAFRVAPDALLTLPPPTTQQREMLAETNLLRRKLGLPLLQPDARLCASSTAHCAYLSRNHADGHEERAEAPGFTGSEPWDRMEAFDYPGLKMSEDVVHQQGADIPAKDAVQGLFDAPYHREPFMDPGLEDFGAGILGGYATLNFGSLRPLYTGPPGIVVYPLPNQKDAPTTFDGGERPDPLRLHDVKAPTGYVISYFLYAPGKSIIQVAGARLTTGKGEAVPFLLNSPANDEQLTNGAFIIPRQPLKPGTRYTVAIQAVCAGIDISRTWSFTTRAEKDAEPAPGRSGQ